MRYINTDTVIVTAQVLNSIQRIIFYKTQNLEANIRPTMGNTLTRECCGLGVGTIIMYVFDNQNNYSVAEPYAPSYLRLRFGELDDKH
ncbi:hypothetical protein MTR_1g035320 [Medicago truncatula]|uniref:Uncharacterized protein n=1 Tax=Medicago truncatula TaxID=3880 RepID=A0A072VGR9_MEDTR|nr:hypothetical protein MTR_1g035320 [Medicago truncatula]